MLAHLYALAITDNIPIIGPLLESIGNSLPIEDYLQKAVNFIANRSIGEQLIGGALFAIIVILGVFSLIKKLSKLIIVVAILVGLYLLYQNNVFG